MKWRKSCLVLPLLRVTAYTLVAGKVCDSVCQAWLKDQQSQPTPGMIGLWGKLPKASSCCDSEVWWEGGRGDRGLLRLSSSEEEGKCGCFGIDWCVSHPANFWASGWPFKNRKQHELSAVSLITFLFPCPTVTKMCILSFLKMLNDI